MVVLAIPVVITAGIWYLVDAANKSYEFPEVTIDATVRQDGSLDLVERRTFDFDGRFGFAFFTVAWPFQRIQGFEVSEGGRTLPVEVDTTGGFRATWRFDAEDERRTFTIRYRVLCAVDVWQDTAHLLWQFVGTGWEVPTESVVVRVHLPGRATRPVEPLFTCDQGGGREVPTRPLSPGETRAWGHGPLQGQVEIVDPQTVELRVTDVPPYALVEGSILFPKQAVPLAPSTGIPRRADILAEERSLAQAANAQRRIFLAEAARRARFERVTWGLLIGLPLLLAVLVLVSGLRERVPGVPRLLREPPEEIHPVRLAHLWAVYRGKTSQRTAYRTQLLHLAQQRVIEVQPVGSVTDPDDFTIRLVRRPRKGGLDIEFAEFLFPAGADGGVSLKTLKGTGKRRVPLNDWWEAVSDKARNGLAPMMRHGGRPESVLAVVAAIAAAMWGIAGSALTGRPFSMWLLPLSIGGLIIALIKIPPRFGPEFLERMARWKAFRRFLTEFSSLDEAPALAVVIWERYLVYATALGVADEVEKQVTAMVPIEELPPPWAGAPSGLSGVVWVSTFNTPVPVSTVASSASSSSWSSSSGSFSSSGGFGGGFSSGGGGGGGGTGGGAG
ncbi:MAG: DUF2207 family protein [Actinomycetota bacterium]